MVLQTVLVITILSSLVPPPCTRTPHECHAPFETSTKMKLPPTGRFERCLFQIVKNGRVRRRGRWRWCIFRRRRLSHVCLQCRCTFEDDFFSSPFSCSLSSVCLFFLSFSLSLSLHHLLLLLFLLFHLVLLVLLVFSLYLYFVTFRKSVFS
jgi:hypothetical protein